MFLYLFQLNVEHLAAEVNVLTFTTYTSIQSIKNTDT